MNTIKRVVIWRDPRPRERDLLAAVHAHDTVLKKKKSAVVDRRDEPTGVIITIIHHWSVS